MSRLYPVENLPLLIWERKGLTWYFSMPPQCVPVGEGFASRSDKPTIFSQLFLVLEKHSVLLDEFEANVVLVEPFTIQKLLNRIRPLLPAEESELLVVGPLRLEEEKRVGAMP